MDDTSTSPQPDQSPGLALRGWVRNLLLIAIAGTALLNGLGMSPYFKLAADQIQPWTEGTWLSLPIATLYLASMLASVGTLLVAGIPTIIYESWRGLRGSTSLSLVLWLCMVLVLTIPTILALAGIIS